jgi:hypothetical protein
MTKWLQLGSVCAVLACSACEVPESWKHASENEIDAPAPQGAGPTRNQCGSGDASCDVPLGRYSIRYTFISGTCDDESSETGVRFSDDTEEADLFPCKDHEISMTADNALYLDRECSSLDPLSGEVLRRTRAQATIYGPHANGQLSGSMDLTVLEGLGAPCTARYALLGTRE